MPSNTTLQGLLLIALYEFSLGSNSSRRKKSASVIRVEPATLTLALICVPIVTTDGRSRENSDEDTA
jgi:hypothetical protein